eukprot:Stramenopile-MAST_4_protein_2539
MGEWHPFSLYPCHEDSDSMSVCIAKSGDWTEKLWKELEKPTSRPCWIYGPFPAPFGTSTKFDNLVLIGSGIGITPSLSVLQSKHINLASKNSAATIFIFYTGKRQLCLSPDAIAPENILINVGRPNLESLILDIISAHEKDKPIASKYLERSNLLKHSILKRSPSQQYWCEMVRLKATHTVGELFVYGASLSDHQDNSNHISISGMMAMLKSFFINDFSQTTVQELFNQIDTNGSNSIDLEEFEAFLKLGKQSDMKVETLVVNPVVPGYVVKPYTIPYHKNQLEYESSGDVLHPERWQVLYCGGSRSVINLLQNNIQRKHNINLEVEKLDW